MACAASWVARRGWSATVAVGGCWQQSVRPYHRRKDPLGPVMASTIDSSEGEAAIVEDLTAKLAHTRIRSDNEKSAVIGKKVLKATHGLVYSAAFELFEPVEYTPEAVTKPGPERTDKVFPRYKLIEPDDLHATIMGTQRYLRRDANANEVLATPRPPEESRVLGRDVACTSKRYDYFFTDTSAGYTDENRRIFIRERDGTLRTADESERARANSTFRARLHNPLRLPVLFSSETAMNSALDEHQHARVLDTICKIRPRDSRPYVQAHLQVYEHIHYTGLYSLLQDSPHFYGFLRWSLLEDRKLPTIDTDLIDALADRLDTKARKQNPVKRTPLARLLSELLKDDRKEVVEQLAAAQFALRDGTHSVDETNFSGLTITRKYANAVKDSELLSLLPESKSNDLGSPVKSGGGSLRSLWNDS